MFWIPLMAGVMNAMFILDLLVTLFTGTSLAEYIGGTTDNSVAQAVVDNIPTDPTLFWILAISILVVVCTIECLVIYVAFYSDISQCHNCPGIGTEGVDGIGPSGNEDRPGRQSAPGHDPYTGRPVRSTVSGGDRVIPDIDLLDGDGPAGRFPGRHRGQRIVMTAHGQSGGGRA